MPKAFKILTGMLLLSLGCSKSVFCQLYDNNWVMCDPPISLQFSNNGFDVDSLSIQNNEIDLFASSLTISDSTGSLLFFSNGVKVFDRVGSLMENGGKLFISQADLASNIGFDTSRGAGIVQNPVCIPVPGTRDSFFLFHRSISDSFQSANIYYSLIDVSKNNGSGEVVYFNHLLNTQMSNSGIAVCMHANAKYWWIVAKKANSNIFCKYLVAGNAIILTDTQEIGPVYQYPDYACQAFFTFQGDRYVSSDFHKIGIYNFDRCTGELKFSDTIAIAPSPMFPYITGCAAGSNGSLLYVTGYNSLSQYLLDTTDISASGILICNYPSNSGYRFWYMQMSLNGHIYISPYHLPGPFAEIKAPNIRGMGCNVDTSFMFTNRDGWGMPVYPHYRTPAVPVYQASAGHNQTVCDSVISASGVKLGGPAVDSITYQWSSTDDAAFGGSTLAEPIVHPTANATYIVHLTDTANTWYSCTDRWDTVHVTVTSICNTAITGVASKAFQLWPTVTGSTGPVYLKAEDKGTLKLYTATGTLLQQSNYSSGQSTITLSNLSPGLYLYSAGNGRHTYYGKIVVQ